MQEMDPGPAKILQNSAKNDTRKCCSQQDTAKFREERQNYLTSNTCLEGKLSSKYYLRFTG